MIPLPSSFPKRSLLRWYDRSRRDLPWRRRPTPYRVWVSEIMLQQTTVATVIPYYDRFLKRFPTLSALARSGQKDVLRHWAGLGYYSRAKNLHESARRIIRDHGGKIPGTVEELRSLPGIGRYTAGAIASIAFGKACPVLDGNVIRVLTRIFGIKAPVKDAKTISSLWDLAEALVPASRPGDWNQALMELGATVCSPDSPLCGRCPAKKSCKAFAEGTQESLPVLPQRTRPIDLAWTCLWIEDGGKVLLWRRDSSERFLSGHIGFPESRHLSASVGRRIKTIRHTITHHRIRVELREARLLVSAPKAAVWVPRRRLSDHLVSSLWTKCLPE